MTVTNKPSQLKVVETSKARAKPRFKVPPLPKSLKPEMRTEFSDIVRHLHERKVWHDTKSSQVENYLLSVQGLRTAQAVLDEDGYFTDDGKPHPATLLFSKFSVAVVNSAKALALDVDRRSLNTFNPVEAEEQKAEAKASRKGSSRWEI